ncbi:MAG: hypothetical protein RLZZ292_2757 [Bacteroidota bacterium]|jgi:hypothetical protein
MLPFLKNHPFPVEAFFKNSYVLTFAVPKEALQAFLPEGLELDTFQDHYAFIAMALVETTGLRPKGFPTFLGNDFCLIGYRIFVRYTTKAGKRLRGLYILKSETNKRKMELLGNIFTRYKYTTTDIDFGFGMSDFGQTESDKTAIASSPLHIQSKKSNFNILLDTVSENVALPEQSPFADWKEARRFAGPLPFTFSYNKKTKKMLVIEGVREDWKPQPVRVVSYDIAWLNSLNLPSIVLANAFVVKNIPYSWKKGWLD